VGAYYFFVAKGGAVSSYDRTTGRPVATATVEGEVYDLRACRGILLVATSAKLYAFRVPDLSLIKTFDAAGIQLINDASCSLVYLVGDKTLYVVLVPSLNLHKAELPASLDGLEVRTGALGVAATGVKRQIALACG
jgi:outer membrane protein assembly factor BamB